MNGEEILTYACERFQEEKFDEALEAFVLAYSKGYEQEWILENIYQCYVEGNLTQFRNAYESWENEEKIPFEECILDFIPYTEGEYYIFDRELKRFLGLFSVPELKRTKPNELFNGMEFSAAVMAFDWNWNEQKAVLVEAEKRKIYLVAHDVKRCSSFMKIPELAEFKKNIRIFSDCEEFQRFFHQRTSEYLPQLVFGTSADSEELIDILKREHGYRLTPEGRNTDNVLLTIAIPTYNRGCRMLERLKNLQSMLYDAEIEVTVSRNGSLFEEEYEKISRIKDARICYYDHGRDLIYWENWRYAADMAHGKYILFVSDQDDVVLDSLEYYLQLLRDNPQVSMVRASTKRYSAVIKKRLYGKRGIQALDYSFLGQGYLSGFIVKREDFIGEDIASLDQFTENQFYTFYPHECWGAVLSQKGDYIEDPKILICEEEVVPQKEAEYEEKMGINILPERQELKLNYAKYSERLSQFKGIADFLHWMMKEDQYGAVVGMFHAIRKTEHNFVIARQYHYDKEHFEEWVNQFYTLAEETIAEFHFDTEYNERLITTLQDSCAAMLGEHKKISEEESGTLYDETF